MLNYWALADLRKKPSSMDYPLLAAKDPPRNGQDKELFYWDYQFKLRVLSQRVDYINFSFTIPEYRVPLVGKIFGWTGSISYDMYGAIYVGGGASLGKSWEGPSLSLTANKLSQCAQPKPEELHNYLSGYSISFDAGYNFGTGFTLSPWSRGTIFSTHAGIYTPQMGGSVTLTPEFLIFQTGYGWAK